jgi:hypothetical protein
MQRWFGMIAIG